MTKRHCFINSKIKDKHIDEISIDKNEDEWRIPCEMYKGLRKQVTLIFKDLVAQEHIISPSFVENYLVGLHFRT